MGVPVQTHQFALTALPVDPRHLDQPLALLAVRLQHPEDANGLTIRYAAKVLHGALIGASRGWRPAARGLHPVGSFVVQPDARAEIVIGAAAARPGTYLLRGFIVDYRSGARTTTRPQQLELEVCASVRSCR